ncbi:MAG: MurR/RpiR family transcriptional regulator [Selenomonadaceae bacterium]|nr:MurR/RpiR family transcriptional regulator [Selenomonadaceae bacterium]MBQ7479197.1 MurR/RpiR family transcriptional regulator [Selenomonadaceae bacterium]
MQLEELINRHRKDLGDTDMAIWKYIFQHRKEVRHISIHKLAQECAVSSTTVVRFAQKLGFDGFGELKARLKMEAPAEIHSHEDVLKDLREFYAQTSAKIFQRNFDAASRLVHEANRVFAFASGYVQSNVVQELKRLFFYDNVLIYEVAGKEEFYSIAQDLTKDDLFIFVSLSGETPLVVEFARQLQLQEIPFLSITKLHDNTLASLSTANLYVSPAGFQIYEREDNRTPFQSMLPYFMLVEVWYVKYRLYLDGIHEGPCTKVQETNQIPK